MARWGTAVPKAVHQGLAPCGRGSCPRSAPRKPAPLCGLIVIDTGPRAPLLRRAAPQLHYKNGCQWKPAKSLFRKSGRVLRNYTKGAADPNALRLLDTSQPDNKLSGHSASLISKATQRGLCGLSRVIPGTPATSCSNGALNGWMRAVLVARPLLRTARIQPPARTVHSTG